MKVLAFVSACLAVPSLAFAETTLLEFSAKWCGPCRDMQPVVAALEREGYRIERVNVDTDAGKARMRQFNVKNIPTFVALTDGRETGRMVGATSADSLKRLIGPSALKRAETAKSKGAPAGAAETPLDSLPPSSGTSGRELIARSVRIVVADGNSRSFGTGTVIRSVPGETIVLTCAHMFEGISRSATTTIEFFGSPEAMKLPGEVVARDRDADLSLVRVQLESPLAQAQVASREFVLEPGVPAQSVGCDNGQPPTVRKMKITAVNRYLGAPTIECNNEPVEGRSGGGLFNSAGELIGVCSAREPSEHRGIYGGLAAIHTLLDRQGLASLYSKPAAGDWRLASNAVKNTPAGGTHPIVLPPPEQIGLNVGPTKPDAEHAEVVCVIRSLDDPKAPARIVVLTRASAEFLAQLEKERASQDARNNTAMRLSNSSDRSRAGSKDLNGPEPPSADETARAIQDRSTIEEGAKWKKDWLPGTTCEQSVGRR